jgi:hypothetical protein
VEKTTSQYLNTLEEEAKKIEKELDERRKKSGNNKRGRSLRELLLKRPRLLKLIRILVF